MVAWQHDRRRVRGVHGQTDIWFIIIRLTLIIIVGHRDIKSTFQKFAPKRCFEKFLSGSRKH